VVGERLGAPDECVTTCSPAEAAARSWAEPNVVLVVGETSGERGWIHSPRLSPAGWALDELAFEHRDGMVTKSEVRAVALAKLGPGVGDLIWDIGAGSGSVAIECARFGAAVDAVEVDAAQAERITRNAFTHGVELHVVTGRAPDALAHLSDPDGVFVGGGGADVTTIVELAAKRGPRSIVVALAALERVGPVSQTLRDAGYATGGVQLSASRLATLPGDLTRLAATNPVVLVWGER
jgi:precorrin-6Y C5,15-methyltransferase (decarboxylating)